MTTSSLPAYLYEVPITRVWHDPAMNDIVEEDSADGGRTWRLRARHSLAAEGDMPPVTDVAGYVKHLRYCAAARRFDRPELAEQTFRALDEAVAAELQRWDAIASAVRAA